ncbi:hypothetical protein PAMA_020923 [Pampus argenteus]
MSTNESTLAENIGRAVLAAIQDFSAATATATATTTGQLGSHQLQYTWASHSHHLHWDVIPLGILSYSCTPNGCSPRLNILHLQNGLYRTIGRMMSTIIIQGGEPPAFLSPSVVDYIVSGDILQVHVTPDDIGDPDLRENLKKVLSLLRENPSLRVLLDIPGEDKGLAADFVAGILKPSYSVLGSNRRAREALMVVKFREFLQCVENKELRETYGDRTLTKDEEAFLNTLSPGHILAFATESSKVPAIGFHPTPKLIFIHDEDRHLPNAHTCANELHLFVNATTMADDDEFNYCFLVALMNGSLFSTI